MKILFSDNSLWGLLNFRIGIINTLLSIGHDVILVAPTDEMCNINLIPEKAKYIPTKMSRTGRNPFYDILYYKTLKTIYNNEKPDYIFHYTIKPNIYGTIAAKSLGIRSSAMVAGLGHVYTDGGLGNAIARMMYKYAMQFPENVFVLNKSNYDTLIERKVVTKEKTLWLKGGEGVNIDRFSPLEAPNNKKLVFLMICRILYDKGYSEYVKTAKSLQDKAIFRLMGPIDSNPSAVKRYTIESDVDSGAIEYIEYSPNVIEQIAKSDCIVLPSSYGEGLSRVLMEALAMAKPIITTDIAGCRETVDDGINGYIATPKDAISLTKACEKFINLSDLEKITMSKKGRIKAERSFNEKDVIDVYLNIINQK